MRKSSALLVLLVAGLGFAEPARATATGTVQGSVTTQGGLPLNGVCPILYDGKATKQVMAFAGTGTSGQAGFYTQANVPVGHYKLLFTNCGANTNGQPDPNYVWIFYGSTYSAFKAIKFAVGAGGTTTLGPQAVPLGGMVSGVITDGKTGMGADTPTFAFIPPGGRKFVLASGIGINCASQQGQYSANGSLGNGKVYYAVPNWACPNSKGVFNFGFYHPLMSGPTGVVSDGAVTLNVTIQETKLCCGAGAPPAAEPIRALPMRQP